jgi:hypothetical protein
MEFLPTSHEQRAQRADARRAVSEDRHRRALQHQAQAESLARTADWPDERRRQEELAAVYRRAADCHRRAVEVFATHRDHERAHLEHGR